MINFIIMVVLGSHLADIQIDRIVTAIRYSENLNDLPIWFLTGGVKYDLQYCQENYKSKTDNNKSEASIMLSILNKTDNIILDEKAKNTAENFNNLRIWINNNNITDYDIVITTSKFHKQRAEKIFNGIFQNKFIPKWNLAEKECDTCQHDELIHMNNVETDIKKALFYKN